MEWTKYINPRRWGAKNKKETPPATKKKRIFSQIKKTRTYRTELEMDKLGQAIESARDPERPSREDLYSIYDQIRRDRHLKSQVDIAINDIQQSKFVVIVDGREDEELREIFDAEWFDDYVEYTAEAEFWGHSLIEFPEPDPQSQTFSACYLIPREHVDPANGSIILDRQADVRLPYRDNLEALNLIEIEGKEDLGLYEYAAEEVILKKYARSDWSQASERYGMPFLDYATDTDDKKELDRIEGMCMNFAANGYIIRGKEDTVDIKQPQAGDFYKIYLEAIREGNKELSKLINGQTGTSDEEAYVGTAEVHERIKNVFKNARLRRLQNHSNGKLIPLMVKNKYIHADRLAKAKIQYLDLLESDDDAEPQPAAPAAPPVAASKKKSVLISPWA